MRKSPSALSGGFRPGAPRNSVSPAFAPTGMSFGVPGAVGERVGFGGRVFFMADGEGGVVDGSASAANTCAEKAVSYTHLRAHETPEHLVCRLLLEKKK